MSGASVALAFAHALEVAKPSWKQDLLLVLISVVSDARPRPSVAHHSLTLPLGRMTPKTSPQALRVVQTRSMARFDPAICDVGVILTSGNG